MQCKQRNDFLRIMFKSNFPILTYQIIVENVYCICDIHCQNNPMNIKYLSRCLKFVTNVFHGLKNNAKQKVNRHYHSKHNQDYLKTI